MKDPNIFQIDNLLRHIDQNSTHKLCKFNGADYWLPARPLGYARIRQRLKAAWLVLTGQADALLWRGQ